jgi:diacylglycerol O-acyltransferase / wax synthase
MTDAQGFLTPPDDQPPRFPTGREFLRRLPWLAGQVLLYLVMFQVYKMVRKQFILEDNTGAFNNATDIIRIEESLGLFFELDLQRWILDRPDWVILFFNNVYAYYTQAFLVSMAFLALMAPVRYRYIRRAFFISMAIATPMYLIYPLAPPRFMDTYGWPFVDTMQVYGPNYFSETGIVTANRFAAMPSMHVGWTTFFAIGLMLAIPNRKLGITVMVAITALMTFTVMVTGNHYWLDAVGGWLVIGLAYLINRMVPYPLITTLRDRRAATSERLKVASR